MPMTEFSAGDGVPLDEAGEPVRQPDTAVPTLKAPALDESAQPADHFAHLPLELIVASRTNPRTTFDQAKLLELAETIKEHGVHTPILLRPLPAARLEDTSHLRPRPTHELVAGERRLRASTMAGVATIPALIRALSDSQALQIQLVENLQREDLSELEEAMGYERLVQETGMARNDIAHKIGRSTSYVHQRMKLLDLCPEGCAALRTGLDAGGIDFSRAQHIARIADSKLQLKALQYALEREPLKGGPRHNQKEVQQWVQNNGMLRLDRARFDIQSATLCPDAGACTACPLRTGANPDLFNEPNSADLCTNPPCYHAKHEAHDEAEVEAAKKLGAKKVIAGKEARELMPLANGRIEGYVDLDDSSFQLGVYGSSVRKELGADCPDPVVMINPHTGKKMALVKESTAKRIIKERKGAKKERSQASSKKSEDKRPVVERKEYGQRWMDEAALAIDAGLRELNGALPLEALRAFMYDIAHNGEHEPFAEALDMGPDAEYTALRARLLALPEADLPVVFARYLLHQDLMHRSHYPGTVLKDSTPRSMVAILAEHTDVDIREVQESVKREMESEDRVKAMEAKASKPGAVSKASAARELAAQPQEGPGGEVEAKKPAEKPIAKKPPAAPAKKPKTSAQEALQGIADAMQGLEGAATQQVAAEPGGGLGLGAKVKVSSAVTQAPLRKWVGKTGTVTNTVGEAFMVSFNNAKGRPVGLCSFMSAELEVVAP